MAGQDQDLVDVDPHDPDDGSIPVFRWRQAGRTGLATRRQLRDMGLRPGGQEPVARIECRGGQRFAWLYRIDLAKPKLPMTLAKEAALDKAMAARQTCPGPCGRRYFHCLPLKTLGTCPECHDGTPADPSTYTLPPAKHLLAA
ncbi:RRQRL motif-containing zinc-binding protein [Streptomyces sp. NPDC059096]|uniref:RRQRL motif-containing zinc-binding protein n=1 Tax=Streptomyces sp. NPDC059096 TaxID=3346727 RepID=UPI00369A4FB5